MHFQTLLSPVQSVAIYGSCCSRDLFRVAAPNMKIPVYIARTGLLSVFDPNPWNIQAENLQLSSNFQRQMVLMDLNKTALSQMKAYPASCIFIDFIDERFNAITDGTLIGTRTNEFVRSNLPQAQTMTHLSHTFRDNELYCGDTPMRPLVEAFSLHLLQIYQPQQIFIHRALMRDTYRDKDGKICDFLLHDIQNNTQVNATLVWLYDTLASCIKNARILEADKGLHASETHTWGLSTMQYEDSYYIEILRQAGLF